MVENNKMRSNIDIKIGNINLESLKVRVKVRYLVREVQINRFLKMSNLYEIGRYCNLKEMA